ncbi:MAG TPA: hypothetical protein VGZ29_01580 [Terriglobia bacterium]|nr:hypothetical protein [Terriglobia bacterium]
MSRSEMDPPQVWQFDGALNPAVPPLGALGLLTEGGAKAFPAR